MIRYALACDQGHTFESWFQNSAAYDKQAKQSLVTCPVCGSAKVEKAIMAPNLSSGSAEAAGPQPPGPSPAPPIQHRRRFSRRRCHRCRQRIRSR